MWWNPRSVSVFFITVWNKTWSIDCFPCFDLPQCGFLQQVAGKEVFFHGVHPQQFATSHLFPEKNEMLRGFTIDPSIVCFVSVMPLLTAQERACKNFDSQRLPLWPCSSRSRVSRSRQRSASRPCSRTTTFQIPCCLQRNCLSSLPSWFNSPRTSLVRLSSLFSLHASHSSLPSPLRSPSSWLRFLFAETSPLLLRLSFGSCVTHRALQEFLWPPRSAIPCVQAQQSPALRLR